MSSRTAMLRNKIADYMKIGEDWELMGTGFTSLNESPNANSENTTYINEVTTSTAITGYETEFEYESDLIPSQKAVIALWRVGRNHLTGDDAQFEYVRVDLYNPIGTVSAEKAEYPARLFTVANEVSDCEGDGGEKITVSGTLHAIGDPILGKFDVVSKTFTAGDYKGKYDIDDDTQPISLSLDKTTAEIEEDGTVQINATVYPAGTEVTWTVDDTSVISVVAGLVTGLSVGEANVVASINVDGVVKTATCKVTVIESV